MSIALHIKTTVLPGSRIEVSSPELPQGHSASVFIVVDEQANGTKMKLSEALKGSVPTKSFRSADEVDRHLRSERESWEK